MTPLFKKLNYKSEPRIAILDAPDSFTPEITNFLSQTTTQVDYSLDASNTYPFLLIFVKSIAEAQAAAASIARQATSDDVTLWIAYPKKSSKRYKTDISRDLGWQAFGDLGFEGVRMVAIDIDWSALRFRKVAFIKNLKRRNSMALSEEGKKRTKK